MAEVLRNPAGDNNERRRGELIGLTTEMCHLVSGAALDEMRRAPARGSSNVRGTYAYQGALSELTVQCEEIGFVREDLSGLPVLMHAGRGVALTLSSGSAETGRPWIRTGPRTRSPKGEITRKIIRRNRPYGQAVFDAFAHLEVDAVVDESKSQRILREIRQLQVWVYMLHIDLMAPEVRIEVSLPQPRQPVGHLSKWWDQLYVAPFAIPSRLVGEVGTVDFPVEPL